MAGTAAVFPGIAAIALAAYITARRGYRPARLFLLSWMALLGGMAIYAMLSFGILPKRFVTEYGLQVGSALEMLLMSLALAYRWAALRGENERLVRETNERLEQHVENRTQELRDGLTGVYNRRHCDTSLLPMLACCLAAGEAFSLLLIDLDHFKRGNDI